MGNEWAETRHSSCAHSGFCVIYCFKHSMQNCVEGFSILLSVLPSRKDVVRSGKINCCACCTHPLSNGGFLIHSSATNFLLWSQLPLCVRGPPHQLANLPVLPTQRSTWTLGASVCKNRPTQFGLICFKVPRKPFVLYKAGSDVIRAAHGWRSRNPAFSGRGTVYMQINL